MQALWILHTIDVVKRSLASICACINVCDIRHDEHKCALSMKWTLRAHVIVYGSVHLGVHASRILLMRSMLLVNMSSINVAGSTYASMSSILLFEIVAGVGKH